MNEVSASRSGFVAGAGRRAIRWGVVAFAVVWAWVGGLLVWGTPERGYLPMPLWPQLLTFVIVSLPAMVLAGIAEARVLVRSAPVRAVGLLTFLGAASIVSFFAWYWHFGGFCIDPNDVCVIRWPSRIFGLVGSVGLACLGWVVGELTLFAATRWKLVRRTNDEMNAR